MDVEKIWDFEKVDKTVIDFYCFRFSSVRSRGV